MRLHDFLTLQEVEQAEGDFEQEICGLAYDSRKVTPGEAFFAVPGEKTDGHGFIAEALKRGAAAIVLSRSGACPEGATFVRVANVRRAMGIWAAHFFGRPSHDLKLIGVTGTNGKTTVSYLIESMLAAAGLAPGVIGTINYRYGAREIPSHHTTPESIDLQALLAEMKRAAAQSVVMEVSSHALSQERVRGVEFDAAVFTNLSRDHLDYHADMEEYFLAKSRLFTDYLQSSGKRHKAGVIYGNDPHGEELIGKMRAGDSDVWSYGESERWDVHPVKVQSDVAGLRGKLQARNLAFEFSSPLIGAANLQNIMGAAGAALALGLPVTAVTEGIRNLRSVPGRLEKVDNNLGVAILVDYAHTPDALEKVLTAVRPLTAGRVVAVFGCGGDRDRGKRPLMGGIAARLSDIVVLTSDNPRTEEPLAILAEIEAGVQKTGMPKFSISDFGFSISNPKSKIQNLKSERGYYVEPDRRAAIRLALSLAHRGDLVLIAGKGHEDYQILGSKRIHFDDREVARAEAGRAAAVM
jgi:UDP-N-acetylmuramoyl-L-alanyl-D-glutamate--2,6-diaminopimelate ligase